MHQSGVKFIGEIMSPLTFLTAIMQTAVATYFRKQWGTFIIPNTPHFGALIISQTIRLCKPEHELIAFIYHPLQGGINLQRYSVTIKLTMLA